MSNAHFIALLENRDLLKNGNVRHEIVARLSLADMIEIGEEAAALTRSDSGLIDHPTFVHTASMSLAGDGWPCAGTSCRLSRVDQLSRFAALYSDKVYIKCLLSRYAEHPPDEGTGVDVLQSLFTDDLETIARLLPLIRAERIVPITPPRHLCAQCLSDLDLDEDDLERLNSVEDSLAERFLNEVQCSATLKWEGNLVIRQMGPEEFFEHGIINLGFRGIPSFLKSDEDLLDQLEDGETVVLTRDQVETMALGSTYASGVMQNVTFELLASRALSASLVTDQALDVGLLDRIGGSPIGAGRNELIRSHLAVLLPCASELTVEQLLELREKEGESFVVFRQALNKAVEEVREDDAVVTEARLQQLYGDVLEPGLARLDAKVRTAKSAIAKSAALDVAVWTGSLSFGLLTGLLPQSVLGAAATLGIGSAATGVARKLASAAEQEPGIRSDDMYWLWRVKQLADRHHA